MIRYNFERVGIRLIRESAAEPSKPVRCPDDAVSVAAEHLADYDREAMIVINMDGAGRPINYTVAGIGCGTMLPLSPKDLIKAAILSNAQSIILMHNHPSGNLSPSSDDITTTKRMKEACELMGFQLLDHVIVGPGGGFYSFMENGFIVKKGGERT